MNPIPDATIVELLQFHALKDVSETDLLLASSHMDAVLSRFDGFQSRTFAKVTNDAWIDAVYWTDLASATTATRSVLSIQQAQAYFNLMDQSSIVFQSAMIQK